MLSLEENVWAQHLDRIFLTQSEHTVDECGELTIGPISR